jgi:hypothetical protein
MSFTSRGQGGHRETVMFKTFGILVIAVGATLAASAADARGKGGGNGGGHGGGHASMGGRVTDHRGGGAVVTNDHRGGGGIVIRDHRGGGVVAPPPPPPTGRPVVSGGGLGGVATGGKPPTTVDGRPPKPGVIIDPCRGNGCPGTGHHGRPFGFGGGFGGGLGFAAAPGVPSNEECFLERRRIQGEIRQVRTCTTQGR